MDRFADGSAVPPPYVEILDNMYDEVLANRVVHVRIPHRELISVHLPITLGRALTDGVLLVVRDAAAAQCIIDHADYLELGTSINFSNSTGTASFDSEVKRPVRMVTLEQIISILHIFEEFLCNFGAIILDNVSDSVEFGDYTHAMLHTMLSDFLSIDPEDTKNKKPARLVLTSTSSERIQMMRNVRYIDGCNRVHEDYRPLTPASSVGRIMGHLLKFEEKWNLCYTEALDIVLGRMKDVVRGKPLDHFPTLLANIRERYASILGEQGHGKCYSELMEVLYRWSPNVCGEMAESLKITWNEVLTELTWMYLSGRQSVDGNVVAFASSERAAQDLYYNMMARGRDVDTSGKEFTIGDYTVILQDRRYSLQQLTAVVTENGNNHRKCLIICYGLHDQWVRIPNVKRVLDTGVCTVMSPDDAGVFLPTKRSLSIAYISNRARQLLAQDGHYQLLRKTDDTSAPRHKTFDLARALLPFVVVNVRRGNHVTKADATNVFCNRSLLPVNSEELDKAIDYLRSCDMLLLEGQRIGYNHPGILGYMYTFVWNVNEINGKMIATYLGVERPMDAMQAATKFGPLFLEEKLPPESKPDVNERPPTSYVVRAREFCKQLTIRTTPAYEGTLLHFEKWVNRGERIAQHDILYSMLISLLLDVPPNFIRPLADACGIHYTTLTKIREQVYNSSNTRCTLETLKYTTSCGYEHNKVALYAALGASSYFGLVDEILERTGHDGRRYIIYRVKTVAVNGNGGEPTIFYCTSKSLTTTDCILNVRTLVLVSNITRNAAGYYEAEFVSALNESAMWLAAKYSARASTALTSLMDPRIVTAISVRIQEKFPDLLLLHGMMESVEYHASRNVTLFAFSKEHNERFLPELFRLCHNYEHGAHDFSLADYCKLWYSALNGLHVSANSCINCMARGHRHNECIESKDSAMTARVAFITQRFFTKNRHAMNNNHSKMKMEIYKLADHIRKGEYESTLKITHAWNVRPDPGKGEFLNACVCGHMMANNTGHVGCYFANRRELPLDHVKDTSNAELLEHFVRSAIFVTTCPLTTLVNVECPTCYRRDCTLSDRAPGKNCRLVDDKDAVVRVGIRMIAGDKFCTICKCKSHTSRTHYRILNFCRYKTMSLASLEEAAINTIRRALNEDPERYLPLNVENFTPASVNTRAGAGEIPDFVFDVVHSFVVDDHCSPDLHLPL